MVFVPNTAVGDRIDARILKVKKTSPTPRSKRSSRPRRIVSRPIAPFPFSAAAVYRHISYEAELCAKRQKVVDCITRIGKLDAGFVQDIIPSKNINNYRNKAMIPVGLDKNGEVIMGFYARHSHRIVHCIDCRLSPDIFNQITADVYAFLRHRPQLVYTPQNRGGVRHLYLRYAESNGDVMVCIVAGKRHFDGDCLFIILYQKNICRSKASLSTSIPTIPT